MSRITHQKPRPVARHHHGSAWVFFGIYLFVGLAVGAAVILLRPSGTSLSPEETAAANAVVTEKATPPPAVEPEKEKKPAPETPEAKSPEPKMADTPPEPPSDAAAGKAKKAGGGPPEIGAEEEKRIADLFPMPDIEPLMEIVDDWQNVPDNAYPKLVAIKKPVDFEIAGGGRVVARGKFPAGSMMKPVELSDGQLRLEGGGAAPISVVVPVEDTDFKELVEARYNEFVEQRNAAVLARREEERQRVLGELRKEETLGEWNDGSDPRFDPPRASLENGEVGVYSLEDVIGWRWGGVESIDGTDYETVFLIVSTGSAFGEARREIVALLHDGKVVRWLDPATGETI